jgi:hypothetical protein
MHVCVLLSNPPSQCVSHAFLCDGASLQVQVVHPGQRSRHLRAFTLGSGRCTHRGGPIGKISAARPAQTPCKPPRADCGFVAVLPRADLSACLNQSGRPLEKDSDGGCAWSCSSQQVVSPKVYLGPANSYHPERHDTTQTPGLISPTCSRSTLRVASCDTQPRCTPVPATHTKLSLCRSLRAQHVIVTRVPAPCAMAQGFPLTRRRRQRAFVIHSKDNQAAVGYRIIGEVSMCEDKVAWEDARMRGRRADQLTAEHRQFVADEDQHVQVACALGDVRLRRLHACLLVGVLVSGFFQSLRGQDHV